MKKRERESSVGINHIKFELKMFKVVHCSNKNYIGREKYDKIWIFLDYEIGWKLRRHGSYQTQCIRRARSQIII